ncbi:MAG: carbohydrate ABC transporter permease [Anaerolineae bacterium]
MAKIHSRNSVVSQNKLSARPMQMAMDKIHAGRLILMLLVALILIVYVFPYLYLVLTSFKPPEDSVTVPPTLFPKRWSLENYQRIGDYPAIPKSFVNSIVIALGSMSLALILGVPAAYSITRYRTRVSRIFMIITLITRMIPYVSVAIPFFILMRRFSLTDTHIAVALAHTTINLPLTIWLLASFFEGVPHELEEAARVDGASRIGALLRVIIPVVKGGIAVTAIFGFLASWNEFLFSLLLTSVNAKTAPIAIAEFKTQYAVEWGTMTALATLYSFPVLLFSLLAQKRIVAGMTLGAIKG